MALQQKIRSGKNPDSDGQCMNFAWLGKYWLPEKIIDSPQLGKVLGDAFPSVGKVCGNDGYSG